MDGCPRELGVEQKGTRRNRDVVTDTNRLEAVGPDWDHVGLTGSHARVQELLLIIKAPGSKRHPLFSQGRTPPWAFTRVMGV
jgi:hypothetical protein